MMLNRPIVIDLYPYLDILYTGIGLKITRQIFILINFNTRTKRFDGYTVFRQKEVERYRYWTKDEVRKVKRDNRNEFMKLPNLNKMKTFYSCLKSIVNNTLVAIHTRSHSKEYFVGKIISITSTSVNFRLIDVDGNWSKRKKFNLKEIDYFSFATEYEKKLEKNST